MLINRRYKTTRGWEVYLIFPFTFFGLITNKLCVVYTALQILLSLAHTQNKPITSPALKGAFSSSRKRKKQFLLLLNTRSKTLVVTSHPARWIPHHNHIPLPTCRCSSRRRRTLTQARDSRTRVPAITRLSRARRNAQQVTSQVHNCAKTDRHWLLESAAVPLARTVKTILAQVSKSLATSSHA